MAQNLFTDALRHGSGNPVRRAILDARDEHRRRLSSHTLRARCRGCLTLSWSPNTGAGPRISWQAAAAASWLRCSRQHKRVEGEGKGRTTDICLTEGVQLVTASTEFMGGACCGFRDILLPWLCEGE
jgi:hypothetical protein